MTSNIDDRRATIRLHKSDLHVILDLPEAMTIEYIGTQFDPMCFAIGVKAPWLPRIPEHESAPLIEGSWQREFFTDNSGKTWVRWGWDPEIPTVDERHPMHGVPGL